MSGATSERRTKGNTTGKPASPKPPRGVARKRTGDAGPGETMGARIARELEQLADDIEAGKDIEKLYTVHRVRASVDISEYGPDDVKRVRTQLNVSQPVFAMFLGVDVDSVQSWEQGRREPSGIARRFMEEIETNPRHWKARFKAKFKTERIQE